jgi:uncharacterized protein YjbJ (UPF0337 family)
MSSAQQQLTGNWNQLKGKLKERWGQLTDDELQSAEGNYDQLVGLIQQRTGEGRQQVERLVIELNEQTSGAVAKVADTARQYTDQAREAVRGAAEQVRYRAGERYQDAQELVRQQPAEAVAVAFGTGLLVGLLIGLMARSRD